MELVTSCPQCGRRTPIPEHYLGRKVRCTSCRTVFIAEAEDSAPGASSEAPKRVPEPAEPKGKAAHRDRSPGRLQVAIKKDPLRELKGVFKAELQPGGLELRQGKNDPLWIRVGSNVEYAGRSLFTAELDGRPVTMAVGRPNLYNERLARDLVAFLQKRREILVLEDYVIPWYLVLIAFLPIGMMGVFLLGGMIGGGLGGAFTGTLVALNLTMTRRERWPMAGRIAGCLAVSLAGYAAVALLVLTLMGHTVVARASGWGTAEDPLGDCRIEVSGDSATIEVPGTYHDLTPPPGRTDAPRILTRVPAGDFVAEVEVVGEDRLADPPAPSAPVAFHGAGLLLWAEAGQMIRLERASLVRGGQSQRYLLFEHLRPGVPHSEQDASYGGGPIHLRLERRGSQVFGAYRTGGAAWHTLNPFPFSAGRVQVGVDAVNTASAPFRVKFRGFTLVKTGS